MAQCLFLQLVWDETSQSFVTYNTKEIDISHASYFIWNGTLINFFTSSDLPCNYIDVVDGSLPEFKGLYYNNTYIQSSTHSIDGDINFIAYYGSEPDNSEPSEPSDPDIPEEGYTLHISYTHTYSNSISEEQSVLHYGAWVNGPSMEYVFYYDENKNIQRIDRHHRVVGEGVFDIPKFSSNLYGYSEENPYYGNAEVKYYISEPAEVWIEIGEDEEGNTHGTTNPTPNLRHPLLDTNIGENCIVYALPDSGYTVDHWSIFHEELNEWVYLDDLSLAYIFLVTEPQHQYEIKVYFKQSDGKIATMGDLNSLLPNTLYKFWSSGEFPFNNDQWCPTRSLILSLEYLGGGTRYRVLVEDIYHETLLVKFSDCSLITGNLTYTVTLNYNYYLKATGTSYIAGITPGLAAKSIAYVLVDFYSDETTLVALHRVKIEINGFCTTANRANWVSGVFPQMAFTFDIGIPITHIQFGQPSGAGSYIDPGNIIYIPEDLQNRAISLDVSGVLHVA